MMMLPGSRAFVSRVLYRQKVIGFGIRGLHSSRVLWNEFQDPYKVLGVGKDASASQIKKAYYKLAKKYHPDINKEADAQKTFHNLQNAYEILSDEKKKMQYDQFGSAAFDQNGGGPGGSGGFNPFGGAGSAAHGAYGDFGGINFEDLFGAAFGRSGGGFGGSRTNMAREYRGENVELMHTITFKEAVFGLKNVALSYDAVDQCHTCEGSGLKKGTKHKRRTCSYCNGTGTQIHVRAGFQMASTCNHCQGQGTMIAFEDMCNTCHGEGVEGQTHKKINIDLPSSLSDGDVIRVPREGSYPHMNTSADKNIRMSRGDLMVRIRVKPDPKFTVKDKYTIWSETHIPITTAALGGQIQVDTVDGSKVRLKVLPGTQDGQVISLPGWGVPKGTISRGDMKVQYKVDIKRPSTEVERCLWEALADVTNDANAKRTISGRDTILNGTTSHEPSSSNKCNNETPSTLKKIEKFISDTFQKFKNEGKD